MFLLYYIYDYLNLYVYDNDMPIQNRRERRQLSCFMAASMSKRFRFQKLKAWYYYRLTPQRTKKLSIIIII